MLQWVSVILFPHGSVIAIRLDRQAPRVGLSCWIIWWTGRQCCGSLSVNKPDYYNVKRRYFQLRPTQLIRITQVSHFTSYSLAPNFAPRICWIFKHFKMLQLLPLVISATFTRTLSLVLEDPKHTWVHKLKTGIGRKCVHYVHVFVSWNISATTQLMMSKFCGSDSLGRVYRRTLWAGRVRMWAV